jgi:hypothetical protein
MPINVFLGNLEDCHSGCLHVTSPDGRCESARVTEMDSVEKVQEITSTAVVADLF